MYNSIFFVYVAWCDHYHNFRTFLSPLLITAVLVDMKCISLCFVFTFLWWLMMLSIFTCAYWSFVHLLWRNFSWILCLFLVGLLFLFNLQVFLYIIHTNSLSEYDLQKFSSILWSIFLLYWWHFSKHRNVKLWWIPIYLLLLLFLLLAFLVACAFGSYIRTLIHFELFFIYLWGNDPNSFFFM